MGLRRKRSSRTIGPVRINRSGPARITSITLGGTLGRVLGWFGYGYDFYRRDRRSGR